MSATAIDRSAAEQRAWAHLLNTDGIGARTLRTLVSADQSAQAALAGGPRRWRELGLRESVISALQKPDNQRIAATVAWLEQPDHHLLAFCDNDFPALLNEAPDPPAALFIAGDVDMLWRPQLAVVGSRNASAGGLRNASDFCRDLAGGGLCITSGLAAGIDAAAHQASVDLSGGTIAVMGTGPDQIYPARHRDLAARIAEHGALVTEFPPGFAAQAANFPRRNRIIAGLALGVLVVEAGLRSGSLITARLASEAGRDVLAIPGSIHNPLARGCHRLLREGATLVETSQEVLDALAPLALRLADHLRGRLGDAPTSMIPDHARSKDDGLDAEYQLLLKCMGHDPVSVDTLVERSGLTVASVSSMLLMLELNGRVAAGRGGTYSRLDEIR